MISPVYSVPKLAKLSGISAWRIRIWVVEGLLEPYTYSGSKPLFRLEDLQQAQKAAKEQKKQKPIQPAKRFVAHQSSPTINEIFQPFLS